MIDLWQGRDGYGRTATEHCHTAVRYRREPITIGIILGTTAVAALIGASTVTGITLWLTKGDRELADLKAALEKSSGDLRKWEETQRSINLLGIAEHQLTRKALWKGLCRETIARVEDTMSISLRVAVQPNMGIVRSLFNPLLQG